jgi:hypothetical protein
MQSHRTIFHESDVFTVRKDIMSFVGKKLLFALIFFVPLPE